MPFSILPCKTTLFLNGRSKGPRALAWLTSFVRPGKAELHWASVRRRLSWSGWGEWPLGEE